MQPVAHILVGQSPQRPQQRNEQQRLLAVGAWRASLGQQITVVGNDGAPGAPPERDPGSCRVVTKVRASMCKLEPSRTCIR